MQTGVISVYAEYTDTETGEHIFAEYEDLLGQWRDVESGLLVNGPRCKSCGESLAPEGYAHTDKDSLVEAYPADEQMCAVCYRDENGCEDCMRVDGFMTCSVECTADERRAKLEKEHADLIAKVLELLPKQHDSAKQKAVRQIVSVLTYAPVDDEDDAGFRPFAMISHVVKPLIEPDDPDYPDQDYPPKIPEAWGRGTTQP